MFVAVSPLKAEIMQLAVACELVAARPLYSETAPKDLSIARSINNNPNTLTYENTWALAPQKKGGLQIPRTYIRTTKD